MTDLTDTQRQLLDQLVEIARQIEAHRTAAWVLEERQRQMRAQLIATGWTASKTPETSA